MSSCRRDCRLHRIPDRSRVDRARGVDGDRSGVQLNGASAAAKTRPSIDDRRFPAEGAAGAHERGIVENVAEELRLIAIRKRFREPDLGLPHLVGGIRGKGRDGKNQQYTRNKSAHLRMIADSGRRVQATKVSRGA